MKFKNPHYLHIWCEDVLVIFGASLSEPHTSVVYGNTCIDWPTVPCPSHSHETDTLHVPMLACCKAMPRLRSCARVVVNSAVRSDDSYKTKNADNGKAKSWDTRVMNCETGTRERSVNLFMLALPCQCHHPWLSRMSVFLLVTLHKPFFTLLLSTTRTHSILDKTCAHKMLMGMHRPHPLA